MDAPLWVNEAGGWQSVMAALFVEQPAWEDAQAVRVVGTDYHLPHHLLLRSARPAAVASGARRSAALVCGREAVALSAIQGRADRSPKEGQTLEVEAVVSAVFPGLNGFFLLEDAEDQDDDPRTSEGLFVYHREAAVAAGQRVRVRGRVLEYHGQTQLTAAGMRACGGALGAEALSALAVPFSLPLEEPESQEGMLVRVPGGLTVLDVSEWGRYGSLLLGARRLVAPTQLAAPGAEADALRVRKAGLQIVLDDGSTEVNPASIAYLSAELPPGMTVRAGDQLAGFNAVLAYGFDAWRLHPIEPVSFQPVNPRPLPPPRHAEANLRVAAFNVMNFFNGDGQGGGFPTARGARDIAGMLRQRQRLVAALRQLDADIVALAEIENDGYGENSAIAELAAALGKDWRYVAPDVERLGNDAIAVGLLYRADVVTPVGAAAWLAEGAFARLNRVPLAQAFRQRRGGGALVVVANHFKSKGCRGATGANADHGEGCWSPVREAAADTLQRWLASDPTGLGGEAAVLLSGDFNAYAMESPIRRLRQVGYQDLLAHFQGGRAYTYVYDGHAGYLDYLLANETLARQVLAAGTWAINADEPRVLGDHEPAAQRWLPPADEVFRASDHDPVYADFSLGSRAEAVASGP